MKKTFLYLGIALLSYSNSYSQTTEDEYNYVTKGYKTQVVDEGGDLKKGYTLKEFGSWDWTSPTLLTGVDKANIAFKAFYRNGIVKPIAIMVIYKSGSIIRYYCIPTIDATDLWNRTLEQLWNERTDHECMVVLTQGLMKLSSENTISH